MGPCGLMRPRGGLVFPCHRPWGRLLKRTKYRMDWPSGVSTHGWLAHCLLLACPMYCGFFAGWHDVFWPHSQQSLYCNKRVKWAEPQWAFGEPAKVGTTSVAHWPACCPHVAPLYCPVVAPHVARSLPFFAPAISQKASKKPAFSLSASAF